MVGQGVDPQSALRKGSTRYYATGFYNWGWVGNPLHSLIIFRFVSPVEAVVVVDSVEPSTPTPEASSIFPETVTDPSTLSQEPGPFNAN